MGQELVKRFFSTIHTEHSGRKKSIKPFLVWLIIGAILFLAVGSFGGEKEKKEPLSLPSGTGWESEGYLDKMELRLKETLEQIDGVGKVSVFLYLEDGGEQVLAANRVQKSQEGEVGSLDTVEEEEEIILWNQDGAESPYTVKYRVPEPSGILVVAEGAKEESVRQEIYEAVRAIFGLPAHRIKITN